jgi:hypothetical protein
MKQEKPLKKVGYASLFTVQQLARFPDFHGIPWLCNPILSQYSLAPEWTPDQ